MPTFYKIDEVKSQWNRNLLPIDFLNTNTYPWTAVLNPGTTGSITAESQSDIKYAEKGIRIQCPEGHDLNDAYFAPTDENHYSFTVPKNGVYIFSFAALLNHPSSIPVEINGSMSILETITNISIPTLYVMPFKIGNNTEPEFSFQFRKWEMFFVRVVLQKGKTYKMEWNIYQEDGSPFGFYDLILDLFKLELVTDKKWEIPSYYTKPGE